MGPSKFDLMTSQLEQQDLESIITLKNIIADKKGSVVRNMLKLDIELDRIISDKIAEQFTYHNFKKQNMFIYKNIVRITYK